jgi:hypothetical protein
LGSPLANSTAFSLLLGAFFFLLGLGGVPVGCSVACACVASLT